MKKYITAVLVLFCALFWVSCSAQVKSGDFSLPAALQSRDDLRQKADIPLEPPREDEALPVPDTAQTTQQPVINQYLNTQPDLISIGGMCEENAEIVLKSEAETVTVKAYGEYFLAQIHIPEGSESTHIEITACVQGKLPSECITLQADYKENEYVYDDDWHILLSDTSRGFARLSFADFEGTNLLSEQQLSLFEQRIRDKTAKLDEQIGDCKLIYMIVPNPLTIYAEEAPKSLVKAQGKTKMDQVLEVIQKTDAVALDLRPVLREHRYDKLQPYLHTDSHWSEYGAYLGLSVLCDYISAEYPAAAIRPVEEYGFENRLVKGGDVVYYLGMDNNIQKQQAPFFNPLFPLPVTADKYLDDTSVRMDFDATSSRITISTGNPELPDCVVFRDSYSIAMYEILPERFNNTSYYYTWGYSFDMGYIKKADPDYVVYIIAERNLDSIIK